jgi:hypothetical protein
MDASLIQTIAVYALPVIFAITLHEPRTAMPRACSATTPPT